jgi:two-component system LytT family response regulator
MRAILVDDEPPARERLKELLRSEPDVEIVGECGNAEEAVNSILKQRPDVVFLDVQMPVLDGFAVLEAVGVEQLPQVVFVTAYDQYAVQAFEVRALDYLLKPFTQERLRQSLRRLRQAASVPSDVLPLERLRALLAERQGARYRRFFPVRERGRVAFVKAEEIDWIESDGNYARLHLAGQTHLLRETLSSLECALAEYGFARIHRHTLVNLERVKAFVPLFNGQFEVLLRSGRTLTLSRFYRERLEQKLGRSL